MHRWRVYGVSSTNSPDGASGGSQEALLSRSSSIGCTSTFMSQLSWPQSARLSCSRPLTRRVHQGRKPLLDTDPYFFNQRPSFVSDFLAFFILELAGSCHVPAHWRQRREILPRLPIPLIVRLHACPGDYDFPYIPSGRKPLRICMMGLIRRRVFKTTFRPPPCNTSGPTRSSCC